MRRAILQFPPGRGHHVSMNFSVFLSPPSTTAPRSSCPEELRSCSAIRNLSLAMLKRNALARSGLPLDLHVTSTTLEDDHAVYHASLASVVTKHQWSVAYRYSEFHAFKSAVEELHTCHSPKCSGSCEAIRDFLSACFPKKRLVGSTSDRAIEDRKHKLEVVLLHLLRCVLLPGSAMKCVTARHSLAAALFEFLGVDDEQDRRSLLQIYVDTQNQRASSGSASTASTDEDDDVASDAATWTYEDDTKCVICLEDVDAVDGCGCETAASVTLPCHHSFHRECIFEWLLFEFHCPLCRARIGPSAVTNYCKPKGRVQWWLDEFDVDPLAEASD